MQGRVPAPLLIAALALFALPPLMLAIGLTMTAATEVVVFAMACMALNILVGYTGLVSFGHGAWFGLAAYAAGLLQRNLMPGSFFGATLAAMFIVAAVAAAFGSLVLRRRGVLFFAAHARLVCDALFGFLPLDGRYRRRKWARRNYAAGIRRRRP